MKNILLFASIAGLAAAIAIYFASENLKEKNFEADADNSIRRGFDAMS